MKLFIALLDNLRISWQMISAHKLRSFLSVIGIVFGILTLLVTLAIGEGTRRKIMRTLENMGANLVYVSTKAVKQEGEQLNYNALTDSECKRLDALQGASAHAPILDSALLFPIGDHDEVITLQGTVPSYQWVRELSLKEGRFMIEEDLVSKSRVVVIGSQLADKILPHGSPIGKYIQLWESSFQIIGILAEKGRSLGLDFDKQVIMPISTFQEIQGRKGEVRGVWIRAEKSDLTKEIIRQTSRLLDRQDLEIWDQEALIAKKDRIGRAFKWALGAIAMVSLLIGGIGIMNVLLVSVAERIKEIGIRKAVGAGAVDILSQFIFESLVLTVAGALIGILLGVVISDYVAWTLNALIPAQESWEAHFSWEAVGISLHFTFWVGLIFGLYPAWKAAKLDPCEALSYQ